MSSDKQPDISVDEEEISMDEWESLLADFGKKSFNQENCQRNKQPAIPSNYSQYLTKLQLSTIQKISEFGWELMFIRRSNPTDTKVVVHFPENAATAVIEKDGSINKSHHLVIRN